MTESIRNRVAMLARCLLTLSLLGIAATALADPLQIEQSGPLPTAIVGSPYLQQLQAQGGVPPYSWTGTIPGSLDLTLSADGVLTGTPLQATDGSAQFPVTVTDSTQTQAQATLTLTVITVSQLAITTAFLQTATLGTQYDQAILGWDGTLANTALNWSVPNLPPGLQFSQIGNPAVADISGTPTQAGIFPVIVSLSDNFGHAIMRQYILTVAGPPVPSPETPMVAIIGEPFSAQLQGSNSNSSWRLYAGELPPGLSLSATGDIAGTVPIGTTTGNYPFSAAVSGANGGENIVALEIDVQAAPPGTGPALVHESFGCATGNGPIGAELLLLAMVWLSASRGRQHRGQ